MLLSEKDIEKARELIDKGYTWIARDNVSIGRRTDLYAYRRKPDDHNVDKYYDAGAGELCIKVDKVLFIGITYQSRPERLQTLIDNQLRGYPQPEFGTWTYTKYLLPVVPKEFKQVKYIVTSGNMVYTLYYDQTGKWHYTDQAISCNIPVDAWMPMPEPAERRIP